MTLLRRLSLRSESQSCWRHAILSSLASTFSVCGLASVFLAQASAEDPGIVKTKPASGLSVQTENGFMVPYTVTIPGTGASFEMIPVPGGKFLLGSPESEKGREPSEGPQIEVQMEPYWVAKTEVTWAEYNAFMRTYNIFKSLKEAGIRKVTEETRIDAITSPTPLYMPSHTFEFGDRPEQPAVTMTQYAAKQYSKWVSGLTGQQFRLPSEVEWEYAARAGAKGAYSFGDDEKQLNEYACFAGNNEGGPANVGTKKPNAFGLHDMHGNVWEWTLDAFSPEGYKKSATPVKAVDAVAWPTTAYPRTVRGGGWQDTAPKLRSAARMGSDDEEWKSEDPNVPLSPWWFTTDPSRAIGFRLVRALRSLPKTDMAKYWEFDCDDIKNDVQGKLEDGRGVEGLAVPELGADLQKGR